VAGAVDRASPRPAMTDYVREDIETIIPHSEFGEPRCSGCLFCWSMGEYAVIAGNECAKIGALLSAIFRNAGRDGITIRSRLCALSALRLDQPISWLLACRSLCLSEVRQGKRLARLPWDERPYLELAEKLKRKPPTSEKEEKRTARKSA
jgi:hypothetical protein